MFQSDQQQANRGSQWAIGGLAVLSLTALIVTLWILADFSREQEILSQLTEHLPASDLPEAQELAGELRLQWQLSVLLILNILASAVALTLLVRAYLSSERRLRDVRVLATDILASINEGILTTDQNRTILSINPQGRRLLSHLDIGIGVALDDLPSDHATLSEICRKVLNEDENVRDCDYTITQNGHVRRLRAGCSLLQDHKEGRLGTVIHLRDVTEKSLMEQRLRRMERYMGLGSVAAGLQHEIKNPLSALALHVQLLDEALADDSPNATPSSTIREILDVLKAETRRITDVLEGFRDFASIAELSPSEVDLVDLIEKLVRLIEPQAEQQGIRVETELPSDASTRVLIDAVRIEQVMLNLSVNAMAAMSDGGTLTIRVYPEADSIHIDFVDTGCGIPEEFRDKVFDPYFTTRSTGTGLGLALSDKIIRQHNGTLNFQTGPEGTVFTISLPRMGTS